MPSWANSSALLINVIRRLTAALTPSAQQNETAHGKQREARRFGDRGDRRYGDEVGGVGVGLIRSDVAEIVRQVGVASKRLRWC